jgi:hypothetical protein
MSTPTSQLRERFNKFLEDGFALQKPIDDDNWSRLLAFIESEKSLVEDRVREEGKDSLKEFARQHAQIVGVTLEDGDCVVKVDDIDRFLSTPSTTDNNK